MKNPEKFQMIFDELTKRNNSKTEHISSVVMQSSNLLREETDDKDMQLKIVDLP